MILKKKLDILFYIVIIIFIVFYRFNSPIPNFSPVIGIAIFISFLKKNIIINNFAIIISLAFTDLIISFSIQNLFVYLAVATIIYTNHIFFNEISIKSIFFNSIISSIIFYLITNMAVWKFTSLYEKNLFGLLECFIMALPFLKNTILSTLFTVSSLCLLYSQFEKKFLIKN